MHRDMSYRKPVPKFIPSPPSSPAISPSRALSIPPPLLPENWCGVPKEEPTHLEPIIFPTLQSQEADPLEEGSSNMTVLPLVQEVAGSTSPPSIIIPPSTCLPERERKRRLHQHYRPPTPPLPAHHKTQRLPVPEANSLQVVYCVEESTSNPTFGTWGPPNPSASLRPAPSFRTEKTAVSLANSLPSMAWSGGWTTCGSDYEIYNLPALPLYNGVGKLDGEPSTASWWHRVGNWAESLKTSIVGLVTILCY